MVRNALAERTYVRAVVGGVAGMLAMAIFAYLIAPASGLPQLDFGSWVGTFFVQPGTTAMAIGLIIALLAGIVWALFYVRFARPKFTGADWLGGTVWGLIAWVLAGVALGVSGTFHPQVAAGQFANPGWFGLAFGNWTMPFGILLTFLLYGAVLGLVEEVFAERPSSRAGRPAAA